MLRKIGSFVEIVANSLQIPILTILVISLLYARLFSTGNSLPFTSQYQSVWFHVVPVQPDFAQIAEPAGVHQSVNEESQSVSFDSVPYDIMFWDDGTIYSEGNFMKFDCQKGATGYMSHYGWNVYWNCDTHNVYVSREGFPTSIVSPAEIPRDVVWLELPSTGTNTPDWWWFDPEPDGTLTFMSPLGDVNRLNAGIWLLSIGSGEQMQILVRQTSDGWQYAEYK